MRAAIKKAAGRGHKDVVIVPVSALKGANVRELSPDVTPWYAGRLAPWPRRTQAAAGDVLRLAMLLRYSGPTLLEALVAVKAKPSKTQLDKPPVFVVSEAFQGALHAVVLGSVAAGAIAIGSTLFVRMPNIKERDVEVVVRQIRKVGFPHGAHADIEECCVGDIVSLAVETTRGGSECVQWCAVG